MTDLIFEHDGKEHRIVCIEYCDGKPHAAITDSGKGHQAHWDFERECKWDDEESYMYQNSGSGCPITEIDLGDNGPDYWLHPSAVLKQLTLATRLEAPLLINGDANIFKGAREIYQTVYCRVCDKYYDEDWCPEHHREKKGGDIGYRKGFRKRDQLPAPRKLLGRISIILFGTAASTAVHPRKGDPKWRAAALAAFDDVAGVIEKNFPDQPNQPKP